MKTVVVGLLGSVLDHGVGAKRWEYWRPSVGVCMQEDMVVGEYHLLYQKNYLHLAQQVEADINSVSPETKLVLHNVEFKDPWDFEEVYGTLLDFCKSFKFDLDREEYLVHITTGTHVAQICWFLLTEARYLPGKLLQTSPEGGKRRKSCKGAYAVIDLDLSKYDKIASRFHQEQRDDLCFLKYGIETRNRAFNGLIEMIEKVSLKSKAPILLTGPTGAGKSKLAGRIYQLKKMHRQVEGRFVEINCATIRGDAAMSALFGHKKGSFTGAVQDRPGLLKAADGGMVFLDEIGEMGADEQTMLLRAIEEKTFTPLGSDTETQSDFQLICGSNKDLHKAVQEGKFREDLLARINLWTFRLPGLAERPEDIEPNLEFELNQFAEKTGMQIRFNKESKGCFLKFALSPEATWPGNFRDLNGAVVRMCTLAPGGRINREVCQEEIERLKISWGGLKSFDDDPVLQGLDPFDQVQLRYVLQVCRQSRSLSEAGRKLFCHSRLNKKKTNDADRLKKYLAKFDLTWPLG